MRVSPAVAGPSASGSGGYQTPPFRPVRYSSSAISPLSTSAISPKKASVSEAPDEIEQEIPVNPRQEQAQTRGQEQENGHGHGYGQAQGHGEIEGERWIPVLSAECHYPLSVFLATLKTLTLHPERNTTFILRADPLPLENHTSRDPVPPGIGSDSRLGGDHSDSTTNEHEATRSRRLRLHTAQPSTTSSESSVGPVSVREDVSLDLVDQIRVRLMPRQPHRDGRLDQTTLFYRTTEDGHGHHHDSHAHGRLTSNDEKGNGRGNAEGMEDAVPPLNEERREMGAVIIVPEVKSMVEIPYYHPPIQKIAYIYESILAPSSEGGEKDVDRIEEEMLAESSETASVEEEKVRGRISIHYLPFPSAAGPTGPGIATKGDHDGELAQGVESLSINGPPSAGSSSNGHSSALPARNRPKRRSPLAGPAISSNPNSAASSNVVEEAQIRPPAVILPSSEDAETSTPIASSSSSSTRFISPRSHPRSSTASPPKASNSNSGTHATSKTVTSAQSEERLYRTCLGMLERLYKHGYGQLVGYTKKRVHDVIVARDNFQDLYLVLKDRHRHLDSRAPKPGMISTKLEDVKRHVWKNTSLPHVLSSTDDPSLPLSPTDTNTNSVDLSEWGQQDVAIAAFLMLLWKDMYPSRVKSSGELRGERDFGVDVEEDREWDTWGRPKGGFLDLGCGNGLLVHILISEGYEGKGYELRTRRTWPLYPPKTQAALVELPIDPPAWFPSTIEEWKSGQWEGRDKCGIKDDMFMIGNHADELTPWLPLLSLLPSTPIPYLSLPCCFHTLDSSFDVLQYSVPEPDHPHIPSGGFEHGLEPGVSRYKSYLVFLAWSGLKCGWNWEKEGLRVPSTKGWGIVARKRWTTPSEDRECRIWALGQVNQVRSRGAFKVREKEGKEH